MFKNIVLLAMAVFFSVAMPAFANSNETGNKIEENYYGNPLEKYVDFTDVPMLTKALRKEFQALHQAFYEWQKKNQKAMTKTSNKEVFKEIVIILEDIDNLIGEAQEHGFDTNTVCRVVVASDHAHSAIYSYMQLLNPKVSIDDAICEKHHNTNVYIVALETIFANHIANGKCYSMNVIDVDF